MAVEPAYKSRVYLIELCILYDTVLEDEIHYFHFENWNVFKLLSLNAINEIYYLLTTRNFNFFIKRKLLRTIVQMPGSLHNDFMLALQNGIHFYWLLLLDGFDTLQCWLIERDEIFLRGDQSYPYGNNLPFLVLRVIFFWERALRCRCLALREIPFICIL